MDYIRSYKSFISSQPLYEGLRTTAGILIPALLMGYFDLLHIGVVISLGAMGVSIVDSPGPIHHRRNAMFACLVLISLVTFVAGYASSTPFVLAPVLLLLCFFYSMLAVYGAREGAIGLASMLILVLSLDQQRAGWESVQHALYTAMGGLWYLCFSVLLYNVRPYKLAQQALGDSMQSIAEYLRLRAKFYEKETDIDANYRQLLQQQAIIQEKQNVLSDLLFKTRNIVKQSTRTGRILVMIYMDTADMFERIMTSYHDYKTLHQYFDETGILNQFNELALQVANELEEIGIAIKSGTPSGNSSHLNQQIKQCKTKLDELRATYMKPGNLDGFISLRRILENIEDLADRVATLHHYTTYDRALTKRKIHNVDYEKFISHQSLSPRLLLDNLTLKSENFRHSVRLSIAVVAGYIGSLFFPFGHSYWILLTIIVILKPAYSLTKSRNQHRLLGTVIGVVIGIVVLYLVEDRTALLIIMILLMTGSYIALRQNYLVNVILMTPYVIIFFHLLNPAIFKSVLADRVIDTAIGSAIAFAANLFLFPSWEVEKIKPLMIKMLEDGVQYFHAIATSIGEENVVSNNRQHLARKDALVALANLSDAFNRMTSEPKWKQTGIETIHHFVVLSHMFTSHIATLSWYNQKISGAYRTADYIAVANAVTHYLNNAISILKGEPVVEETPLLKEPLRTLNEKANMILEKRQVEVKEGLLETETKKQLIEVKSVVDQFNFIFNIAVDLNKTAKAIE